MKAITVKFSDSFGEIGSCTAWFPTLPGTSQRVEWENKDKIEAMLSDSFPHVLPEKFYAETFSGDMIHIASRSGLTTAVEESGEWEVFFE